MPPSGLAHLPAAAVAPSVPAAASRKLKLQPSREQQQQQRPQKQVLTSSPNTIPLSPAQASLSYSLSRLLSLPRFAAFLHTPLGFAQFAAYLSGDPRSPSLAELELWKDTHVLAQLIAQAEAGMRGIASVYLAPDHPSGLELPEDMRQALYESLAEKWGGQSGLDRVSKHLLESLYRNEFEGFIKTRLVRHTQAQLAKYNLKPEDRGGIESSFILTNPRLRDDPIVLVSPGFCELTVRLASLFSFAQSLMHYPNAGLQREPDHWPQLPVRYLVSVPPTRPSQVDRPDTPLAASCRARRRTPRRSVTCVKSCKRRKKSCSSSSTTAPTGRHS